ncbi:sigma-70 family RNA polymerase sigma factor [Hymenobacter sp. M29]|uniref:Sigma-70 family RNA polymerase sigma factor n=1 Tax=Hymenobacter mellowenesis TaxID=3063995 RepID=A0ABT9AG45_9BACT|nr:sigma-70 family RNA polymerase sigma factor [Hymenobacter sp. M29]MDO7848538.1 sigma-70 family RNA polymerase sigma factor [Hymenobacter sp. M29]
MPAQPLWDAFRQGDEQAFTTIFVEHYEALYNYGMKLVGDEELVRDSIQELFQKLWERRAVLEAVETIKPYLFKVLRNRISDNLKMASRRSARQQSYHEEEFEVVYVPDDFLTAEQLSSEQHAQLLAVLNQLPQRQREVLYLKYFDGFSYEKISEVMSLTAQSVRNLIYRAIKALKELLLMMLAYLLFQAQVRYW